jgi:hypothetical protein
MKTGQKPRLNETSRLREDRVAAALRENLRKRKLQQLAKAEKKEQ